MDKQSLDTNHAIKISERIWWVGHYIEGDPFQCHTYLIENGDQSVLFDPGSKLTFNYTLGKIEEVTPFSNIRYFVCHHQDPDITAAMGLIDQMVNRDDVLLVTHWRAAALLKHYDLKNIPFWQVEEHDWKLELDDRTLRFIFTPYMHFPGAFCTFDEKSGIMFSSDIFGGFTEEWSLYAKDESHFEAIKPFHEHYMPSREIMQHGLSRMREYPIRMIAPQHGSIIPETLVDFMFDRLAGLDCGLYLMVKEDTDIKHLVAMNQMLRESMEAMMLYRDFSDIAHYLLSAVQKILPIKALSFMVKDDGQMLLLAPDNFYHGAIIDISPDFQEIFSCDQHTWQEKHSTHYKNIAAPSCEEVQLVMPLFSAENKICRAAVVMHMEAETTISAEIDALFSRLMEPLLTAVEREIIFRSMEEDRDVIYERSIRDPLTGLFTRLYMKDTVSRMLELHDREINSSVSIVMFDVDHFKHVNDTYGHMTGDEVLKKVSSVILTECRTTDIPVRFGGEEFLTFIASSRPGCGKGFAERVREKVGMLCFNANDQNFSVTISAGIAAHAQNEPLQELIHRVDIALYAAKESGRNRVCIAPDV
ncbi:MAG: diguanylate cyclase [Mariprofundus sp.]|nr:diguanylate cyclase [Mariprofundus sp.]